MAQFYKNLGTHPQDLRKQINENKSTKFSKPIGIIGQSGQFEYGYLGDEKYYVSQSYGQYITNAKLSFEEAKCLFEVLCWEQKYTMLEPKQITSVIKDSRKQKLSGNKMFWFFLKKLFR